MDENKTHLDSCQIDKDRIFCVLGALASRSVHQQQPSKTTREGDDHRLPSIAFKRLE